LVVMRGFFFSGRLTIPYVGMEAVLLKDCQRGAMQGRRAADHVERGNPGWYGGTGRGRVLVLGWAALRACQDAGKAAYEAQCNEGRVRVQYCKSTRGNFRLVLSRAGKSTSRDSTQRKHQSKSGEHGEWLPLSADCGLQGECANLDGALKCAATNAPVLKGNRYDCGVMPLDSVHS
jgi:hypothetical protein